MRHRTTLQISAATLAILSVTAVTLTLTTSAQAANPTQTPASTVTANTPVTASVVTEATALPSIGDCYNLTYAQSQQVAWPTVTTVSCDAPHTVEVYAAGTIPSTTLSDAAALVNYLTSKGCTTEDAWTSVNANKTNKDGIVNDPLRVGSAFFTLPNTAPSSDTSYVCTTTVVEFNGEKKPNLQTLSKPLAAVVKTNPNALAFCSTGTENAQMSSDWNTANCGKKNTWKVTRWVELDQTFNKYPGAEKITAVMDKKCDATASYTFPTEKDWNKGRTTGWCHTFQN